MIWRTVQEIFGWSEVFIKSGTLHDFLKPFVYLLQVTLTYTTKRHYERSMIIICIIAYILVALLINKHAKADSAPIVSASYSADSYLDLFNVNQYISIHICSSLFYIILKTWTCSTITTATQTSFFYYLIMSNI